MLEHRLAKLAACATFLLLIIGGMVNATGSSLACPEATLVCHGSLFPPMSASTGVLYEHGHRLAAETVGLLQIALTIALLRRRPELKKLAWLTLGMVLAQASLGAITVYVKLSPVVSSCHLVLGMSYLATLVYVAFRTAPRRFEEARREHAVGVVRARRWIYAAAGAVMLQLVLGALVRHLGAWMVCLGMPSCSNAGDFIPATTLQKVHMLHRAWGCMVAGITTVAAIQVWRAAKDWPGLRRLALVAPVLVATQIVLGVYVVLTMRSVPVAVAHFAGAAALWALWMSMLLMTSPRSLASRRDLEPPRAIALRPQEASS